MGTSAQNYSDLGEEFISEYPPYPSPGQALRSPAVVRRTTIPKIPKLASAGRTKRNWLMLAVVFLALILLIVTVFNVVAIKILH